MGLSARWSSLAQRRPLVVDVLPSIGLAALGLVGLRANSPLARLESDPPATWVSVAFVVALAVPLCWRRRLPLATLSAVTAVFLLFRWFEVPEYTASSIILFLALVDSGVFGRQPHATWARGAAIASLLCVLAWEVASVDLPADAPITVDDLRSRQAFAVITNLAFFAAGWAIGDLLRGRHEREAELRQRTAELEAERLENARRAVLEERVRIARELHDVVAHHVSVMGVQAGAARLVMSDRPADAVELLEAIESSSRDAVGELHRLLGFLRAGDEPSAGVPAEPQPGLGRIGRLVDQVQEAGLDVRVRIEAPDGAGGVVEGAVGGGGRPALAPGVDLSAYRIVQEALTNTLKHAGPARAEVVLRYEVERLEIEVCDDGRGGVAGDEHGRVNGVGLGICGMRERAELHGGSLEAGPRPGGGFGVVASLPLDGHWR
ncbi:MAG: sensor histidine kinase [Actinomycetota bacterium]|nr:sensor histidine kinase [Actinomycetota bacterium]